MLKIPASHENCGGCSKFRHLMKIVRMSKIPASHENYGGCLKFRCLMKIMGDCENLGGYTEYRCLVKIQPYDRTMTGVKISAPR
jgi:hypothetical protein